MFINAGKVDQPFTVIQAHGRRQHPFSGLMQGLV